MSNSQRLWELGVAELGVDTDFLHRSQISVATSVRAASRDAATRKARRGARGIDRCGAAEHSFGTGNETAPEDGASDAGERCARPGAHHVLQVTRRIGGGQGGRSLRACCASRRNRHSCTNATVSDNELIRRDVDGEFRTHRRRSASDRSAFFSEIIRRIACAANEGTPLRNCRGAAGIATHL